MPITEKIQETDEGQLDLKGNELIVTDKTSGDPAAFVGRSRNGGICKFAINAHHGVDEHGVDKWIEIGYLLGKCDERYPGQKVGEFQFWLKAPGDAAADTHVCSMRHDGVVGGATGGDAFAQQVLAWYHEHLGRRPGAAEIDGHRGNPGGLEGVLAAILGSQEYRDMHP